MLNEKKSKTLKGLNLKGESYLRTIIHQATDKNKNYLSLAVDKLKKKV